MVGSTIFDSLQPWWVAAGGGAAAVAAAAVAGWRVRGSTAVPAAGWAVAAGGAITAECVLHAAGSGPLAGPSAAASARLAVAAVLVCPAMSLLGAKRPQHGIWQLIVASLAVVLAAPAATALLVRPGSLPEVHFVGRVFLVSLAAMAWMNFLGTRRWPAATLAVAGGVRPDAAAAWLVGLGGFAAATTTAADHETPAGRPFAAAIDRPFVAIRETLGAAWALRIAERFNGLAEERGWPCRLSLAGLAAGGDPLDRSWHRDTLRCFQSIMRRFVSRDRQMTSPATATPAIRVSDLVKRYDSRPPVDALRGLSLEVARGECFGLLGPNGAGKTTTVEILEGLLPPTSGTVELLGLSWQESAGELRERIGVSLQETRLSDKLTVAETIHLFRSFYRRGIEPDAALDLVGLLGKKAARSWAGPSWSSSTSRPPASIRSRGVRSGTSSTPSAGPATP